MIRIRLERFPSGTVKKLHARSVGPFQILKKLNDNAYAIDISKNFAISYTFNVEGIVDYKGPEFNPSNPLVDETEPEFVFESPSLPPLPDILPDTTKNVDKVIDELFAIKVGESQRYLICWKGKTQLMIYGLTELSCNGLTRNLWSDTGAFLHLI